jgi:serine/threonine protein phosphatase PrpC
MQRLVEAGELTEEEAAKSERRNIILQALGPDAKIKVDLTHQELRRGDTLVLCSDGLSGQVKKEEIGQISTEETDLSKICDRLIALRRDGGETADVVYLFYEPMNTETSTEPVPVYKGSPAPVPAREARWRRILGILALAALILAAAWIFGRSK